jgi:hypothetical protein
LKDPIVLGLLAKCFIGDQAVRITAMDAANHPRFAAREAPPVRATTNLHPTKWE